MVLVDKDVVFDKINKAYGEGNLINLKQIINNIPTIDAIPVVHAYPIYDDICPYAKCSNCGQNTIWCGANNWDNYCSKCGAKMDGENDG